MKEIVRLTRYNRFEGLLDGPNSLGDRQPRTAVMCTEQIVLHAKHGTGIMYMCKCRDMSDWIRVTLDRHLIGA